MYDFLFFFQIVAHDNIGMFVLISVRYKYVVLFLFQTNKKCLIHTSLHTLIWDCYPFNLQSLIFKIRINPYFPFHFLICINLTKKKVTNQKAQMLGCWAEVSVLFRTH